MRFTANCLQRASKCRRGLMKDYWHVDCRQRITVIYEPKIARLAALHRAAKRGEKKWWRKGYWHGDFLVFFVRCAVSNVVVIAEKHEKDIRNIPPRLDLACV